MTSGWQVSCCFSPLEGVRHENNSCRFSGARRVAAIVPHGCSRSPCPPNRLRRPLRRPRRPLRPVVRRRRLRPAVAAAGATAGGGGGNGGGNRGGPSGNRGGGGGEGACDRRQRSVLGRRVTCRRRFGRPRGILGGGARSGGATGGGGGYGGSRSGGDRGGSGGARATGGGSGASNGGGSGTSSTPTQHAGGRDGSGRALPRDGSTAAGTGTTASRHGNRRRQMACRRMRARATATLRSARRLHEVPCRWSPARRRRHLHPRWRLLRRLRLLRSVGLRRLRRARYYGGYYDPWYGGYPTYPQSSYTSSDEGSLKLKIKPRQAEVYVDGYFVGVVDDFDGIFQRLHVDSGAAPHRSPRARATRRSSSTCASRLSTRRRTRVSSRR